MHELPGDNGYSMHLLQVSKITESEGPEAKQKRGKERSEEAERLHLREATERE